MQQGSDKISVIIIAYNEEKYIAGILDSLLQQTDRNFEVIVVDSNSSDGTEAVTMEFASEFEEFRYIRLDVARGPAHGRNRGAAAARYERLLFFDADTAINPRFVERVNLEMQKRKLDVATCPIRILEGGIAAWLSAIFLNTFMILLRPVYSTGYGACFISSKGTHQLLGGFDEEIGLCEDCHYIKRARRQYGLRFGILSAYFFTSARRALAQGGLKFMLGYVRIHLYRMLTGREIRREEVAYSYGNYNTGTE